MTDTMNGVGRQRTAGALVMLLIAAVALMSVAPVAARAQDGPHLVLDVAAGPVAPGTNLAVAVSVVDASGNPVSAADPDTGGTAEWGLTFSSDQCNALDPLAYGAPHPVTGAADPSTTECFLQPWHTMTVEVSATGTLPDGSPFADTAAVTVEVANSPGLEVSVSPEGPVDPGTRVTLTVSADSGKFAYGGIGISADGCTDASALYRNHNVCSLVVEETTTVDVRGTYYFYNHYTTAWGYQTGFGFDQTLSVTIEVNEPVAPVVVTALDKKLDCDDIDPSLEQEKIKPKDSKPVKDLGAGTVTFDFSDETVLGWESTVAVDHVLVKDSNGWTQYTYDGGTTGDSYDVPLKKNKLGTIMELRFCYSG